MFFSYAVGNLRSMHFKFDVQLGKLELESLL